MSAALLFIVAAIVILPVASRLGVPSAVGFIVAGVVISPLVAAMGLDAVSIQFFAEIGIVFLFFAIGLELSPSRLLAMRAAVFGLGGASTAASTLVPAALLLLLTDWPAQVAIVCGLAIGLSSAVLVLRPMQNRIDQDLTQAGRGIVLFQCLAVIAVFYLLPFVSLDELTDTLAAGSAADDEHSSRLVDPADLVIRAAILIAALVLVRVALRPILRIIEATNIRDLFTAMALGLVLGMIVLCQMVGLPPVAGGLVAGVLAADTRYRNQLEADIRPFQGLLIGLYFMTIGVTINFGLLFADPLLIFGVIVAALLIKVGAVYVAARVYGLDSREALMTGFELAPGGELGLAVVSVSAANSVVPFSLAQLVIYAIVGTMVMPYVCRPLLRRIPGFAVGESTTVRKLRVFISYSRRDAGQAMNVVSLLERHGVDVIIDTEDMPFGEEWQRELDYHLKQSDLVIWMVSRQSIESNWCRWELDRVLAYHKRILPVLIEDLSLDKLPPGLEQYQVLPRKGIFDYKDKGHKDMLVDAVREDNEWLKQQTRLSERARLWVGDDRNDDWLLRGTELDAARNWQADAAGYDQDPAVLDLIHASTLTVDTEADTNRRSEV